MTTGGGRRRCDVCDMLGYGVVFYELMTSYEQRDKWGDKNVY